MVSTGLAAEFSSSSARRGGSPTPTSWRALCRSRHPSYPSKALSTHPVEKSQFRCPGHEDRRGVGHLQAIPAGCGDCRTSGFEGVEIHGANGYLLDQFLRSGSNERTDIYGGSLENRALLPLEVTKAVIKIWGGDSVGYRISPHMTVHSMSDANPRETFSYFTRELNKIGLGYIHLIEPIGDGSGLVPPKARLGPTHSEIFERTFILNGGYDFHSGN